MTTSILNLDGSPVQDFSDPDRRVMWSKRDIFGGRVYGSMRTIAHLDRTSKRSERRWGHEIEVIQGAYNTDVPASAGTHDKDACLDIFIPGIDFWVAQRWLRFQGWAAWYRYPPLFSAHIHMISLGYRMPVGEFVPGQVEDYYNHRTGLAGHLPDNTVHPRDIDSTIFDFAEWEREMEEHMPLNAEDKKFITTAIDDRVDVLQERVNAIALATRARDRERHTAEMAALDEIAKTQDAAARAKQIETLRRMLQEDQPPPVV